MHTPVSITATLLASPLAAQATLTQDLSPLSPADQPVALTWGDFDADGLDDALAIGAQGEITLLRNAGDGSFEDVTAAAGLEAVSDARFALWQDFDRDGLEDLFFGTNRGPAYLMQNVGATFLDVTAESGIGVQGAHRAAHWLDYDGDRLLDLHVVAASENTLYHARAEGGFEPVELPMPAADVAVGGVLAGAADADGVATDRAGQGSSTGSAGRGSAAGSTPGGRTPLGAGGGSSSAGGSAGLGATNILSCVHSIEDANGGACLEASATPTLGMLYALSQDLCVEDTTGHVGIGTVGPDRKLNIVDSVANDGVATFDNPNSAGFAGVYFEEGNQPRGWAGHVNGSSGFGAPGTMQLGSQFDDMIFSVSPNSFFNERMRITTDGNVGIGTNAPNSKLQVSGMIRVGSESGTSQAPNQAFVYTGMVVRRIVSTLTTAGQVVARSRFMRVERDGTTNGLQLAWDAGSLANQVAYGTALTNGGTVVPIVINLGAPASAGTMALFAATDVVKLDLAFGTVFNTRELTEITLVRPER